MDMRGLPWHVWESASLGVETRRVVGGCEYGAIGVEGLGEDSPGVGATLLSLSVEVHVQLW